MKGRQAYPLLLPAGLWLLIFFFIPMAVMAYKSLQVVHVDIHYHQHFSFAWKWSNYADNISQYKSQFIRSFVYAGVATVAAFVIAYPLAYVIAFRGGRWKNLLLLLVIAPFFTNYLIRTLAWQTILADNSIVTRSLATVHFIDLTDKLGWTAGGRLLATPFAVVSAITYNYLAFMVLPLYVSLEKIDPRLLEASLDLYANRVRAFLKVTLPMSLPGVFAGTLLTFIPATGDYINAEILGNANTHMIGNVIQSKFLVFNDYPAASALSFTLMAIMLVFIAVY
ncbi:MAG: spermidine/putrescine transport system permease protein, partial [Gaiellales bacterium]|nr:spermidine/putrescine transport system permease protein [Gaiellales bacterium]